MADARPGRRPARPFFSSGPCAKRPGWSPAVLDAAVVGRSHRSKPGVQRLRRAIDLTREVLELPDDYRVAVVPGSDTGAVEIAMWSLLGARGVDMLAWDSFGKDWVKDAVAQLKLADVRTHVADYGALPDLSAVDPARDVVFTWNGTTSGVRVPSADFIAADRQGLTICDATSAVFAQAIDWRKIDVATFSWQKALGSEGAHGMLILGPRAAERLVSFTPDRPMPKLFRLVDKGKLNESLFTGSTINTPSMLCVEDYLDALGWAKGIGGLESLRARSDASLAALERWVERTPWIAFLAADPATRSNTSVCFKIADPALLGGDGGASFVKDLVALLEDDGIALDIAAYRDAPTGLRIWCGPTVDTADVVILTEWLDWAAREVRASRPAAAA